MQDRDGQADEEELSSAEAARDRRRDRDAGAAARAGMGTGLAKQFKQVLDVQARRADETRAQEIRDQDEQARRERRGGKRHRPAGKG